MTKPLFAVLSTHHPSHDVMSPQVWDSIGHPELALDPDWRNTCAVRMSIALIAAGLKIRTFPARLWIKAGPYTGEQIEPSQRVLSDYLAQVIGQPERYKGGAAARNTIASRRGIISFFQLHGRTDHQGHIDLISTEAWPKLMCNGMCFWDSVDVWFWPLK